MVVIVTGEEVIAVSALGTVKTGQFVEEIHW